MLQLAVSLLAALLLTTAGAARPAVGSSPVDPSPAGSSPAVWYFPATGHSLTLGFAHFVMLHGGTDTTGLPITEEFNDKGVVVQYFQHLRLEWRPERPDGSQVVVSALGVAMGKVRPAVPAPSKGSGATYFPITGHSLADGFLTYYREHDGPAILGAPISEELSEGGAVVQYFQDGALQWRPGVGVTAVDLGSVAAADRGWTHDQPPLAAVPAPGGAQPAAASEPIEAGFIGTNPVIAAALQPGGLGHLTVPVLMYHHIGSWPSPYSVATANFVAQLDWLQAHGYHSVTLQQVFAALYGPSALPANPVVISIDDGYPDAASGAVPVLLQHHMTATFFIPTVQTPLSPATLRRMDAEGFDIEAHSRTHPDLTTLNDTAAESEIAGSKQDLERILGHSVDLFAYPYGAVNPHVVALLERAGFRGGILAGGGRAYSTATPYAEPRILVDRGDDLTNFVAKVTGQRYRDTLNSGGAAVGAARQQPAPHYQQPPVTPAPATTGNADTGTGSPSNGGTGTGAGSTATDGTGSGAPAPDGTAGGATAGTTGSDGAGNPAVGGAPTSRPGGHGEIFV